MADERGTSESAYQRWGTGRLSHEIRGMNAQLAVLSAHRAPLVQRGEYTGGRSAYVNATERFGTVIEL